MKRRVDDIITYALATILTVMFSWATIMYWPPWQRLQRFRISFDETLRSCCARGAPDNIKIAIDDDIISSLALFGNFGLFFPGFRNF
jgi:hypothetical protein